MRLVLKFGMPGFLVLLPLVVLFGFLYPWQVAGEPLSHYTGQSPVMVGFSYRSQGSLERRTTSVSRSYILYPSVLADPKIVSVRRTNEERPVVEEQKYGFVLYVAWLIACVVGTWWFWFRPRSRRAI